MQVATEGQYLRQVNFQKNYEIHHTVRYGRFEWDLNKATANLAKHGIDFFEAMLAFLDDNRVIATDAAHSEKESRHVCIGKVGHRILTVRFTYRQGMIRIIGAGHWKKGRVVYESLPSWEAVASRAVVARDDHTSKLVYTCQQEAAYYSDPRYLQVAARRVGLREPR